ncbi:hypothetical protein ColTof4_14363 [Colletotrichum tofieldiae]|nr:hypothetical protein ColTof3_14774 [Colletotrichum tofieldiae]GKT81940.1 hypothetical protein ColTof4_14363 [Colletotrichum tofieldiae]
MIVSSPPATPASPAPQRRAASLRDDLDASKHEDDDGHEKHDKDYNDDRLLVSLTLSLTTRFHPDVAGATQPVNMVNMVLRASFTPSPATPLTLHPTNAQGRLC